MSCTFPLSPRLMVPSACSLANRAGTGLCIFYEVHHTHISYSDWHLKVADILRITWRHVDLLSPWGSDCQTCGCKENGCYIQNHSSSVLLKVIMVKFQILICSQNTTLHAYGRENKKYRMQNIGGLSIACVKCPTFLKSGYTVQLWSTYQSKPLLEFYIYLPPFVFLKY